MVEMTLLFHLNLSQILLPLSLEELKNCHIYWLRIIFLKEFKSRQAFMEVRIVDFSSYDEVVEASRVHFIYDYYLFNLNLMEPKT